MSKFSGVQPPGQPRSLRKIIEAKLPGGDCPEDLSFDYSAGVPTGAPGVGGTYNDAAQGASGRGQIPRAQPVVPFTSKPPAE